MGRIHTVHAHAVSARGTQATQIKGAAGPPLAHVAIRPLLPQMPAWQELEGWARSTNVCLAPPPPPRLCLISHFPACSALSFLATYAPTCSRLLDAKLLSAGSSSIQTRNTCKGSSVLHPSKGHKLDPRPLPNYGGGHRRHVISSWSAHRHTIRPAPRGCQTDWTKQRAHRHTHTTDMNKQHYLK